MKNKGFTLVELLAVIVILGILLTIAIPSVLKVSNNVKVKSYNAKIELIESAAVVYGENNLRDTLSKHANNRDGICWLKLTESGGETTVTHTTTYTDGYYPCYGVTLEQLVKSGDLKYDDDDSREIINPVNDVDIKTCSVYVYFRNNRIYATFDKVACDSLTVPEEETPELEDPADTLPSDSDRDVEDKDGAEVI